MKNLLRCFALVPASVFNARCRLTQIPAASNCSEGCARGKLAAFGDRAKWPDGRVDKRHFAIVALLLALSALAYAGDAKTLNTSCETAITKAEVIAAHRKLVAGAS
jgi:hypothetical protein